MLLKAGQARELSKMTARLSSPVQSLTLEAGVFFFLPKIAGEREQCCLVLGAFSF